MAEALSVNGESGGGSTGPKCKVIVLIDMDSFECQIWQRMYPEKIYWGKPCIVVDAGGR